LYGGKFTIVTDNRPLVWIFNVKDPSSRLLRWRLKPEEYEYDTVYKRGSSNTNADALSRIYVAQAIPTEHEKLKIFQEMHMKPAGGHLGTNKTYERMKLFPTWPGMKQGIENYIKKREICQKNKMKQHKVKMPLQITTNTRSCLGKNAVWTLQFL